MNDVTNIEHLPVAHAIAGALSAAELVSQLNLIKQVMRDAMEPSVDYGYVPGTEPKNDNDKKFKKPALFKPGAEKLLVLFRLGPDYEIVDKERDGDHLTITSKCILTHIPSGRRFGSALGSCSTMESKYAYRHGSRACPECGVAAIIKGKAEYGGGWLCFKAKDGCGAKFADGDPAIERQQAGKVANEDKADQYNTVLKMSNKRALIAATLNATAASAIFSQDIVDEDDLRDRGEGTTGRAPPPPPPRRKSQQAPSAPPRPADKKPEGEAAAGGIERPQQAQKSNGGAADQPASEGMLKMVTNKLKALAGARGAPEEAVTNACLQAAGAESVPALTLNQVNAALEWIKQENEKPAGEAGA